LIRALSLLALCAMPAAADPLRLDFPFDCTLGETCYIQNYVDQDPGPEHRDFGCGALSYDGHRGTDIALLDMAAMFDGVDVHAASFGTVTATRDGMPDILFTDRDTPDITNRACGNAVIIKHADGWETRYCHLKQGSVSVRTGDSVTPDTLIGQVGLSGKTAFPHLHIGVSENSNIVDPFQPAGSAACGDTSDSLWRDDITYRAGGLVSAGFADLVPEFDDIKAGTAQRDALPVDAAALVVWAQVFGGRRGYLLELTITGPSGPFLDKTVLLKRTQARLFRAIGRKRRDAPWQAGRYTGLITLSRDGIEVDRMTTVVEVR